MACFYRALATGEMSLAAPLTAVIGAGVPAAVGILAGERLEDPQLLGLACGLAAVLIVSRTADDPRAEARSRQTARSLPLILLAGLGFAGFFLAIGQATAAGSGTIWWPLLSARATTVVVAAAVIVAIRLTGRAPAPGSTPRRAWASVPLLLIALAGLGDFGGNGFFLLADSSGAFSLAVILSSLYPVLTVILAGVLLRERLSHGQLSGVGLAIVGVVLIAL
ncbi:MAG: EamA/RhaT family transporter [Chloroflexota bacterium]|nr:MAG: EamA/RhaT family transporter [Chloroflexota bacterium]